MREGQQFLDALKRKAKMVAPAAEAVCAEYPDDAAWLLDTLAVWTERAYGDEAFDDAAKGYFGYVMGVAKAQRQYEAAGKYTPESLEDIHHSVYAASGVMVPYMWAAILIYAFWPSMINHLRLYRDEFLSTLPENARLAEFACGHGVLGLLALENRPDISLVGIDISASAIEIARRLSEASGHAARSHFIAGDAISHSAVEDRYDAIIAAMLAEHLEKPTELFDAVARRLVPNGRAFVSTAIESAQQDHVYEYHSEGEVVAMAENAGLRVLRMISDRSAAQAPGARFTPRACALIVESVRHG